MSVEFDKTLFWERLESLYAHCKTETSLWNQASTFLVVNGKQDPNVLYQRTLSLQLYLCGYELFDTVMLFTPSHLHILASPKKIKLFEALGKRKGNISLNLLTKQKGSSSDDHVNQILAAISQSVSSGKLGLLEKETPNGAFYSGILAQAKALENIETVDISAGISGALAIKSPKELEYMRMAGKISSSVLRQQVIPKIESCVEEETPMTHAQISEFCEQKLLDAKALKPVVRGKLSIEEEELDICYTPIIMSGNKDFDLRPSATSSNEKLSFTGTIVVQFGSRFHSYCSNIGRTLLVNATKDQEAAYRLLVRVRNECLKALTHDAVAGDVYKRALRVLRADKSGMHKYFTKNVGFRTGLDFRDSSMVLSPSNTAKLQSGMVFVLGLGFNLKTYAVYVADTVVVTEKEAKLITKSEIDFPDVSYKMDDDVEDELGYELPDDVATDPVRDGQRQRRRGQETKQAAEEEEKRREEQKLLASRRLEENLAKYASNAVDRDFDLGRKKQAILCSYEKPSEFPRKSQKNQMLVDIPHESVLLPIGGRYVPFHVDTIKSVSKSEEIGYSILRINFITPESALANRPLAEHADRAATYVRELSYKSSDAHNINKVLRLIKELQKRVRQREMEVAAEASLAKQPPLKLNSDRATTPRLRDLSIRPALGGKKARGFMEAHLNGLRYRSDKGQTVDISYSNIKHAFFQPCQNTIMVIIHFELKAPIKCGKSNSKYVQVYTEVIESSQDLHQRRNYYDRDGLLEEQQERERTKRSNQKFKEFMQKVEESVARTDPKHAFDFDIPYQDLMFTGTPNKSAVNILPTLNCLVSLDDTPPWVLTLSNVEVAYFERVQLSLKQFDLVFVYKDLDKNVEKIRSIPTEYLSIIQSYLNESQVMYYSGSMNLQWPRILKQIRADPKGFYEMGGWGDILGAPSEAEEEDDDPDSEFVLSEDLEEYEESEESEFEEEEEFEESEIEEPASEEEEGQTWEELESEAARADRVKNSHEHDERADMSSRRRTKKKSRRR